MPVLSAFAHFSARVVYRATDIRQAERTILDGEFAHTAKVAEGAAYSRGYANYIKSPAGLPSVAVAGGRIFCIAVAREWYYET